MTVWAFDIETDGLLRDVTKLHLGVFINTAVESDVHIFYSIEEVTKFMFYRLGRGDSFVGHNLLGYDLPALAKLGGIAEKLGKFTDGPVRFFDTLLLHKLLIPRHGESRSLGALGVQLFDLPKLEFSDFSQYSKEMEEYCLRDTQITVKLYNWLRMTYKGSGQRLKKAIELEHRFALIIGLAQLNGFPIDYLAIEEFRASLEKQLAEVDSQLHVAFPGWFKDLGLRVPKVGNKTRGITAGEAYHAIEYVEFNPGSHDHLAKVLQEMGWTPLEFTETGKPSTSRATIAELDIDKFPQAKLLVERSLLKKRISETDYTKNLINGGTAVGWEIDTLGAITRRCTHANINIANVVKSTAKYAEGVRKNFRAPYGWRVLGVDLTGIEFRMLAEYLAPFDQERAAKLAVQEGVDIHYENAKILGLEDPKGAGRNIAKTFLYAMLYGASALKLGKKVVSDRLMAKALACKKERRKLWEATEFYLQKLEEVRPEQLSGIPPSGPARDNIVAIALIGRQYKKLFFDKFPGLKALADDVEKQHKLGKLYSIDGYRIHATNDYSALNSLLQMAGSIAAKAMTIQFANDAAAAGYRFCDDWYLAAHVHDEMQLIVREEIAETLRKIALKAVTRAGKDVGFNIRLDGEAKIGYNWADTH